MISITPNRVRGAEFHRNVWCVTPEKDTTAEAVLAPGYFTHVAQQLRVGDHVEVCPEGAAWYLELFVLATSKLDAKFGVLRVVTFAPAEAAAPVAAPAQAPLALEDWRSTYYIKWGGPKARFRIHRLTDHEVLEGGFDTAEDAEAWLAGHLQAMAA